MLGRGIACFFLLRVSGSVVEQEKKQARASVTVLVCFCKNMWEKMQCLSGLVFLAKAVNAWERGRGIAGFFVLCVNDVLTGGLCWQHKGGKGLVTLRWVLVCFWEKRWERCCNVSRDLGVFLAFCKDMCNRRPGVGGNSPFFFLLWSGKGWVLSDWLFFCSGVGKYRGRMFFSLCEMPDMLRKRFRIRGLIFFPQKARSLQGGLIFFPCSQECWLWEWFMTSGD